MASESTPAGRGGFVRRCQACGGPLGGARVRWQKPGGDAERDPVREDDRQLAREVLAGWRVRLAAIRTQRRLGEGLEPTADDLDLLAAAAAEV